MLQFFGDVLGIIPCSRTRHVYGWNEPLLQGKTLQNPCQVSATLRSSAQLPGVGDSDSTNLRLSFQNVLPPKEQKSKHTKYFVFFCTTDHVKNIIRAEVGIRAMFHPKSNKYINAMV